MIIDGCAHKVQTVALVNVELDAVCIECQIMFSQLVKAEDVAHAGAATASHAHAQCVSVGY